MTGWVEAHMNRFMGVEGPDTALEANLVAARRDAWWARTALPLLGRMWASGTVMIVLALWSSSALMRKENIPALVTATTWLLLMIHGKYDTFVAGHRVAAVALPTAAFLLAPWPPTSDACFRRILAGPIMCNTAMAIFSTPSFSEFVACQDSASKCSVAQPGWMLIPAYCSENP